MPPIITADAPAARALVISPEYLMPPSAMMGSRSPARAAAQSAIAVNWGTPAPDTTRVVQMEPGPTPTFTASAPAFARSFAAAAVPIFPATNSRPGYFQVPPGFTAQIPGREAADQRRLLGHGTAGNSVPGHELIRAPNRLFRRNGNPIADHPAVGLLDLIHFGRLIGAREYAMHHS